MIDPISMISLAAEATETLVKAVALVKKFAETLRDTRKELMGLILRMESTKNIFQLLRIAVLDLQQTSSRDMALVLDEGRCRETLQDLYKLVSDIANAKSKLNVTERLHWVAKRAKVLEVSQRLQTQEDELMRLLMLVNTASTFRTQRLIEQQAESKQKKSEFLPAFGQLTINNINVSLTSKSTSSASSVQKMWLGHILTECVAAKYAQKRSQLAHATYYGQWDRMFSIMEEAKTVYNESWVNAIRMKPLRESDQMSFWTPLHQAAYNQAPVEVITKLISLGASRVLRTQWSPYSYRDMTALDLAHEFQVDKLYSVLAPVIRQPIPLTVLSNLQARFHQLIRDDMGVTIEEQRIYLPVLEMLIELVEEPVWFPISQGTQYAGYAFQLDRRELLVQSFNVDGNKQTKIYRISEEDVVQIEEALVLNG